MFHLKNKGFNIVLSFFFLGITPSMSLTAKEDKACASVLFGIHSFGGIYLGVGDLQVNKKQLRICINGNSAGKRFHLDCLQT